ncbi:hypothetical protein FHQ18_00490 [Deferribacter autotrophicus]|uniref:TonB C-terminal domain-containing protein n=1 Tax=Deferribacter autotrophicus TaxID=500465 RepID=A0A5A8F7J1_9BACT|nr:hypothetical protein [Deferribacter autotrophicus]KAA0259389.1 hypothetical protein FHQ18_00490 [Deferribacter autotrophicus]
MIPEYNLDFKNIKPKTVKIEILKQSIKKEKDKTKEKEKPLFSNKKIENLKEKLRKKFNKSDSGNKEVVEVPTMTTEEKVLIPDLNNMQILENRHIEKQDEKPVLSELERVKSEIEKTNNDKALINEQQSFAKNDFYEIKSITNLKRKIVYEPPKPSFSLERGTKITLSFKVDRYGRPFDINLLTRSSSNVEKIAIDFVKGLRFDAVDYNKPDFVEITLFFRVR